MRTNFQFRSSDIPILIAGAVILIGVMAWFKVQAAAKSELITTRITLATLQEGLMEYQHDFHHLPPMRGHGTNLHQFLVDYQIARMSCPNATSAVLGPDITHFIRPQEIVRGTIHLPNGRSFPGVVNVKDGFGGSIRYLPTQTITWRAPCFASVPPGATGHQNWIFSR
jgi:hypothetical protein